MPKKSVGLPGSVSMGVSRSLLQSYGSSGLSSSLHLIQNEIAWSWCSLATVILQSSQCMCAHGAPEIAPDPCRNCLRNPPPSFCCRKWVRDRKYKNRNGPFQVCLPSVSQPVCIWLISARKVSTYANHGASSPKDVCAGYLRTFSQLGHRIAVEEIHLWGVCRLTSRSAFHGCFMRETQVLPTKMLFLCTI